MNECTSCIAEIECTNETPGCTYPEPHDHGLDCDKTCAYCHGQGVPVKDPENHPRHKEWGWE
jgi:hypothetical protein